MKPCKHSGYTICLECREDRTIKLPDIDYDNLNQQDIEPSLKTLYEFKTLIYYLGQAVSVSIDRIQKKCNHPESTYNYHGYDGYKKRICDLCNGSVYKKEDFD